jgi:hypothetical protein
MTGFRQGFEITKLAQRNHADKTRLCFYNKIRLEIIIATAHIQPVEPAQPKSGFANAVA